MKYCPILFIMLLMVVGCTDASQAVVYPKVTVTGLMQSIGEYMTWAGAAATALCLLAYIASMFSLANAILGGFRPMLLAGMILGTVLLILGVSFIYLGEHPWIIAAMFAIAAVCAIAYFHDDIHNVEVRIVDAFEGKSQAAQAPQAAVMINGPPGTSPVPMVLTPQQQAQLAALKAQRAALAAPPPSPITGTTAPASPPPPIPGA
jgi:hypothetical protein